MSLKVGFAKSEILCFFPGLGMMGYGQAHNVVKEQATPLWARVLLFEDEQQTKLLYINCEIAFITIALKESLTERLQKLKPEWNLSLANIVFTAQHTHSAPGGYSHYPFYNFTIPGFQVKVFEAILNACIEACLAAEKNLELSSLKLVNYEVPENLEIAFNRSINAYRNNPDVKKISAQDTHLALNRKMQALNIYDLNGKLRAHLNWFGVHSTSVSSFNQRIHHDNKGIAAKIFELKNPNCLAIFAQAAAGDISPNFIWDKKLKRMRGKFEDQYESAEFNGELQANAALMMQEGTPINGKILIKHMYYNMISANIGPAHGVAFFMGTAEGPGVPAAVGAAFKVVSRFVKLCKLTFNNSAHKEFYEAHGKKDVLLDHRSGEFIGLPLNLWKLLPIVSDPVAGNFIRQAKAGAIDTTPWVPPILPLQVIKLGSLVLLGVPGEITTVAAERLKKELKPWYKDSELIVTSYANAYMGYITTPEEYDIQCYEAGHTVYGRNTLNQIISGFKDLAANDISTIKSFAFPVNELNKRSYR